MSEPIQSAPPRWEWRKCSWCKKQVFSLVGGPIGPHTAHAFRGLGVLCFNPQVRR